MRILEFYATRFYDMIWLCKIILGNKMREKRKCARKKTAAEIVDHKEVEVECLVKKKIKLNLFAFDDI